MKRSWLFVVLVLLTVLLAQSARSQQTLKVPFGSTPNPVGSGARAIAWGGAFIAIADDATAASWNPAGLIQLIEPEASVALAYHSRTADFSFSRYDSDADIYSSGLPNLNYASVVYPFHVGSTNLVASLNYQRLYEFETNMRYTVEGENLLGTFIYHEKFDQTGSLSTVTPALAVQVTPAWSMGLSVNLWGLDSDGNGWEQNWVEKKEANFGTPMESVTWSNKFEEYTLTGTNFVIGTHIKLENFTIGAVYKTAFDADLDFKRTTEYATFFPNNPNTPPTEDPPLKYGARLTWPDSYGVGLAWRYSDRLSFALDYSSTLWSHYRLDPRGDKFGGDLNLITGRLAKDSDVSDTWQVRTGMEYLWIQPKYIFALRGGVFYDPEPGAFEQSYRPDGQAKRTVVKPGDYYGASIGGGLVYKNFVIDAALQARFANDIEGGDGVERVQAAADIQDYLGIVSLIYHF